MDDSPGCLPLEGDDGTGRSPLSSSARLLLWDYDRGSLPYDLLCLFLLLVLLAVPSSWWRDPLRQHVGAPPKGQAGPAGTVAR